MYQNIAATLAAALLITTAARAAEPAARSIPTLDFFKHEQYSTARISPNGRYLAMTFPAGDQTRLGVIDLQNKKISTTFQVQGKNHVTRFFWIGDERLVFATAIKSGRFDAPQFTGDVFVGNADGSDLTELHGKRGEMIGARDNDDRRFELLDWIPGDPLSVLVKVEDQIDDQQHIWRWGVYRLNTKSRSLQYLTREPLGGAGSEFATDQKGQVRFLVGQRDDQVVMMYRDSNEAEWKEVNRFKGLGGSGLMAFSADGKRVYVGLDHGESTAGIYLFDPSNNSYSPVFRDQTVDVDDLILGRDQRTPIGVSYDPDYPNAHFFDPKDPDARIVQGLMGAFPNMRVRVTSFSRDGKFGIVEVSGDTDPGTFYLVNTESFKLAPLFAKRPWIKPELMSPMKPVAFKARDGLPLHGYLTVPRGAKPERLPMVVLVHGGPMARDTWGFDSEVQFFANRGYSVLQVNFRGSSGYGAAFQSAGYGHWGQAMQDDVTDATRWAIEQGIADPKRICIVGASYGGYAALMGVEREPDLYRCAVGYVGVYDLFVQKSMSDTAMTFEGKANLDLIHGSEGDDLRARSPLYHVDQIKVPVFLAAGGQDERVPIRQFNEMTSALDKAHKTYETLIKDKEGHGFYNEANQVELYDRILKFLDNNTQPSGPASP